MSCSFRVKIHLPSGKSIRVSELKNRDYLIILKYCENLDLEGLNDIFNSLFFSEDLSLDIIDKFYLLLTIRMLFIDPDLTFADKANNSIKFNISNILEKIDHFENDFERTVNIQNFTITLGLPNIIYFKDISDIYNSTIKTIVYNNKVINFNSLSVEEREQVLTYIPNTVFSHINKYIALITQHLQDFILIDKNEQFNIAEVNTNIISNEFMGFILSIFSTGLKNFFELLYAFSSKIQVDGSTFYELSPLDTRVIINIYNKDITDQNNELQKQNQM